MVKQYRGKERRRLLQLGWVDSEVKAWFSTVGDDDEGSIKLREELMDVLTDGMGRSGQKVDPQNKPLLQAELEKKVRQSPEFTRKTQECLNRACWQLRRVECMKRKAALRKLLLVGGTTSSTAPAGRGQTCLEDEEAVFEKEWSDLHLVAQIKAHSVDLEGGFMGCGGAYGNPGDKVGSDKRQSQSREEEEAEAVAQDAVPLHLPEPAAALVRAPRHGLPGQELDPAVAPVPESDDPAGEFGGFPEAAAPFAIARFS
jgi:hypothetical protein